MIRVNICCFGGMSINRIHSPSNPPCLAPCLWSPGLTHSLNPYSLSVHSACACGNGIILVRRMSSSLCKQQHTEYTNESTHISRFGGMSVTRNHPRHIYPALIVCPLVGFTHRRIRHASPLVSGHPVSPTHPTRTFSLPIVHL